MLPNAKRACCWRPARKCAWSHRRLIPHWPIIMPAILDRSPLMVAFSSGGASPVLTRLMRGKLETVIPQNYSRLAAFAERFRELVKKRVTNPAKRRIFWENTLEGVVAEKVLTGDENSAEAMLQQM